MNGWLVAAAVLLVGAVGPTVPAVATGPLRRRVGAQNHATALICLVLLLLAQGFARPSYVDTALVLSLLGPAGTLVYARLLGPDLKDDPPRGRIADRCSLVATVAVVLWLCVAAGPGRAAVKLLVTGALLVVGNQVASRALRENEPEADDDD
ncbi:monovalent cation/H+ antiporter complex subunit F [Streptomyces sp. DT24]|uniref:monovalent cation/H+ antiporter complex subunit F n=1 Tax=Streptomyces sp. DT24 TaxID=3416520 RepID=UPI003CF21434